MPGYPVNSNLEPTTENWRISQHCFSDEIRSQMTLPEKFQLCDITLREGRQLPGVSLRRDEVIRIADALVDAGVSMVQMHHDDPKEMEEVKKRHPDLIVEALVHPTAVLNPELAEVEVDLNVEHGADYTTLCFSFSPNQMCLFESMAGDPDITIEQAIMLHFRRHGIALQYSEVNGVLRHLVDFSHLDDDPAMEESFGEDIRTRVEECFRSRQPQVAAAFQQLLAEDA